MCDCHITAWLRRARDEGRLPNRVYIGLLEQHVQEVCASCRQEAEAYARGGGASLLPEPRTGEEWQRAAEELETLLALPADEWVGAVQRARRRFQSPALARLLIDRSFACLPHDPQGSLDLATVALAAAEGSGRPGMGEAHVLALAHQGNALRTLGRLPEAGRCFERARGLIRSGVAAGKSREVVADLGIYARLAWWEGVYHRELGQWAAAEERLNRAALFFTIVEDLDGVNRVALSLGELYVVSGGVADALEAVTTLLKHLGEDESPRLYWMARFNYAYYLAEAELYETAKKELRACTSSPGFPRDAYSDRRVAWLGGRIDYELGDPAAAEPKLAAVRAGYLEEGSGINMALASLDLALVYLAQGRTAELKRTAEELTLIFGANDVHTEAMTALILLQEAVRQEQVTAAYLGRLRKYLDRSRHQPGLAFEKPS
jgi:tetratricopeptide (TPR) repeat protein